MESYLENKKINKEEIETKKTRLKSFPRMLMIVLTTRCNLECIMCARTQAKNNLTIPFEKIRQIRSLFPYLEAIDWQGGEVFLVDYFKELFLEARAYANIDQSVITNGLLINQEWADIFATTPRINLTYSIDAVTKKTYETIRKGARFEELLRSIERVNRANAAHRGKIQLHINAVVMRSNYKELKLFPEFCKKYGFKHLRFDFLRPDVAPQEDLFMHRDYAAIEFLNKELEEIQARCKDIEIWFEYTFKPFLANGKLEPGSIESNLQPKDEIACRLPWKKLYIDAAAGGSVRPDCLCLKNAGSILESSIEEIWNNQTLQSYREKLASGEVKDWCSETCLKQAVDTYQFRGIIDE